jgi:hypothetical protein
MSRLPFCWLHNTAEREENYISQSVKKTRKKVRRVRTDQFQQETYRQRHFQDGNEPLKEIIKLANGISNSTGLLLP